MDEKIPHRWFQREGLWRSAQRGGVVWISRRAHNPEIDGSNPSLAILMKPITTLKKRDNP